MHMRARYNQVHPIWAIGRGCLFAPHSARRYRFPFSHEDRVIICTFSISATLVNVFSNAICAH